ncbi:hypothetical protein [Streptobacillus moniliformis]|uniref:Uncharacterized protein n=1 Tax=Streptobacillus moniliformis (strain ATCC 14647 / DSM 12112 / NCTC 10651 / 9901) TaxID=519441 RepID=D1AUU1_STRM9|nr:hypothetical protein [Streptobacillus moniliformis]ACZ01501.1 hypothetical protein Smon_1036 [Streptobacillus moniliformis DSM 12112]AVL43498.1 hypothetical protein CEP89_06660 [Streptobacillus moniliformis]QXW66183.1 hypothetical protein KX935_02850 [Streptobacillus moniliformis]SQA13338.1 Uncharacterised protein [Streptobacillus moniliformis]
MYTIGDEFEFDVNDSLEYFICIGEFAYSGIEYLICENEYGIKKVFFYDDEELILVEDEDEEENVLDNFQEESYKNEKEFTWYEENDYNDFEPPFNDENVLEDNYIEEDMELLNDYSDEEDINTFLDDLFDDED